MNFITILNKSLNAFCESHYGLKLCSNSHKFYNKLYENIEQCLNTITNSLLSNINKKNNKKLCFAECIEIITPLR